MEQERASVIRKERFNAAHRLHVEEWSAEKNRTVFGKCNNPNYHGHNYLVEVRVSGPIDQLTGFVMDAKELSDLIKKHVIEPFDHRNLNLDVADFEQLNPTAENIAKVIYLKLRPHILPIHELKVRLDETEKNSVEYPS